MELIALGRPVVAAPPDERCTLCGDDGLVTYVVLGDTDTIVCADSRSCVLRALAGVRV